MKTSVSIPDGLFRRAEAAARRLGVSRSRLYASALAAFLDRARSDRVTERLNEVYATRRATLDSALHHAQLRSVEKAPW